MCIRPHYSERFTSDRLELLAANEIAIAMGRSRIEFAHRHRFFYLPAQHHSPGFIVRFKHHPLSHHQMVVTNVFANISRPHPTSSHPFPSLPSTRLPSTGQRWRDRRQKRSDSVDSLLRPLSGESA